MPREIPSPSPEISVDGVIFQRTRLRQAARADRLEKEARKRASALIHHAEQEAAIIRQEAFRQGYEAGMLTALSHTASYMSKWQTQANLWYQQLESHSRVLLSAAVDHPDTLLLLLDEWLRDQPRQQASLRLLLPRSAQPMRGRLMALLNEQWDNRIEIDYHDDPRFILRCGQQMAEFAPADFVEQATRQLRNNLSALPDECRHLSEQAIRQLIETLKQQCQPQAEQYSRSTS
ncbi:type III secretion system linker protein OrgB [Plesiomonas sp.]|uniref:type III secretion system linker protein OrgB n=1 Tax=Plesiomonas sp. TaxID=2486279 RepID=UPI003F330B39